MDPRLDLTACTPEPVDPLGFNPHARLPYGLTIEHLHAAMRDFVHFLGFVNTQLYTQDIERLESLLMPANFSSIVGEFMSAGLPKYCPDLVKNTYHNGHPDLIPTGRFPGNAAQHADEGIEIKASRYAKAWQGHNPEDTWLMVFVFAGNRPTDAARGKPPVPFRFLQVVGARLAQSDWIFAGRSATSRRTITASVNTTGYQKLMANWIYQAPALPR